LSGLFFWNRGSSRRWWSVPHLWNKLQQLKISAKNGPTDCLTGVQITKALEHWTC
jgi:hypothetical protein